MLQITLLSTVLFTACCICKTLCSSDNAVLYAEGQSSDRVLSSVLRTMRVFIGCLYRDDAELMAFRDLTLSEYKMFCDPAMDIPTTVNGSAATVQCGNCTIHSQRTRIAQDHGIQAVLIVSHTLSKLVANSSSDCTGGITGLGLVACIAVISRSFNMR